ncbi:MAG TPA: A/G-specific adenine glycosylase, partial [Anaerolineaceae bacterium]|nr:A/G-specific adenine glycosylase [Anaerolineaceae bacterium]
MSVQNLLLNWYDTNARELPWRSSKLPYHTLVSEFMLQQTQVETVLPYYQHFIETWPTVQDLANAKEQAVLKAWEGLGYYRRAVNLHRSAKMIV